MSCKFLMEKIVSHLLAVIPPIFFLRFRLPMGAIDISMMLEPELVREIPFGTRLKINELISLLEKQSEERISELEKMNQEKLRSVKQQLDSTTRKLLETEMHLVKLRAESHAEVLAVPQEKTDLRPKPDANRTTDDETESHEVSEGAEDWAVSVRAVTDQIEELKKALACAENFSSGGTRGDKEREMKPNIAEQIRGAIKHLEDAQQEIASHFQKLENEKFSLGKAIEEYQCFIYEKEKECYTLQSTNNDLTVEVSELGHVKKAYKSLYDAYFKLYLRVFEYQEKLASQEKLISKREEFFRNLLGSVYFQRDVMETLRKLERNIRYCGKGDKRQGASLEKESEDNDNSDSKMRIALTDLSDWHRGLEDVRQRMGQIKITLEEFKRLFDVAAFEASRNEEKAEATNKADFYLQENAVLRNEIHQLKKTLEQVMMDNSRDCSQRFTGPTAKEKESVESLRSENEIVRQELENNKKAYLQQLSVAQEAAQRQMAQYEEYICKQNELLDRYRKLKEVYLAIRARFQV